MARPRTRYYIACDEHIGGDKRPTKQSADRLAQKMANETGFTWFYYSAADRRRARRMGRWHKVYLVPPTTDKGANHESRN